MHSQPSIQWPEVSRFHKLRRTLLRNMLHIETQQLELIEPGFVDDYLALHWLEKSGSTLTLTNRGRTVCLQFTQLSTPD